MTAEFIFAATGRSVSLATPTCRWKIFFDFSIRYFPLQVEDFIFDFEKNQRGKNMSPILNEKLTERGVLLMRRAGGLHARCHWRVDTIIGGGETR